MERYPCGYGGCGYQCRLTGGGERCRRYLQRADICGRDPGSRRVAAAASLVVDCSAAIFAVVTCLYIPGSDCILTIEVIGRYVIVSMLSHVTTSSWTYRQDTFVGKRCLCLSRPYIHSAKWSPSTRYLLPNRVHCRGRCLESL